VSQNALSPPAVRRHYGPTDRIGLRVGTEMAVYYRCRESNASGHIFERIEQPGYIETFTHEDVSAFEKTPGYRFDRALFAEKNARARLTSGVDDFSKLPDREKPKAIWMADWVKRFEVMRQAGLTNLRDHSVKAAIATIQAGIEADAKQRAENLRAGGVYAVKKPPSVRTLLEWRRKLIGGGGNPIALRHGYRHCGGNHQGIDSEVETMMVKHARRFAAENRPLKVRLYEDFTDELKTLNEVRVVAGSPAYPIPCDKTFFHRIDRLTSFEVCAGQLGLDNAGKEHRPISSGLDVTRPGERIEIDEWRVPLQTLMIEAGVWEALNREERRLVARARWWLNVAIDAASRCILGMRLSKTATSVSAIATLAMCFIDKKIYADAVGALTPWDQFCGIETVCTDQGSAYIGEEFKGAAVSVGAEPENPPAGLAEWRARIERLFGTAHTQLISRFTGRSFHNVVALAGYPSEDRASLTLEELSWAFVRYFVDVYHNSPHEGLDGETPRNCFKRLSKLYGVVPPPDAKTLRNAFGLRLTRRLEKRGVRVANLHFQSLKLQEFRRKVGSRNVQVRLDPNDIGAISVKVSDSPENWLTVPCIRKGFVGVRAADWLEARLELRRQFGDEAKIDESIVRKALAAIQEMAESAVRRAGISTMLTAKEINDAERRLTISWAPSEEDEAPGDAELFDGIVPRPLPKSKAETSKPATSKIVAPADAPDDWSVED
jgi:putative transposase